MHSFVALLSAAAVDAVRVVKTPSSSVAVATSAELVVDGMSFESLDLQVAAQRPQDGDPVWEAIKAFDAENECQNISGNWLRSRWEYWYKASDRTCASSFRYMGSLTLTKLRAAAEYNASHPCWRAADLAEMEQHVSSCIEKAPKQPTLPEDECKEIRASATAGATAIRVSEGCDRPFSPRWCSCQKSFALLSQYAFRDVMECGGVPDQILALLQELETCKEELPEQSDCQRDLGYAHNQGVFERLEFFQQEPTDADTCSRALAPLRSSTRLSFCSKEFVAEKLMIQAYVRKCAPIGFKTEREEEELQNDDYFTRPFGTRTWTKEDYCSRPHHSDCSSIGGGWRSPCMAASFSLSCAYVSAFSCGGSPEQIPEMEAKVATACTKFDD